ncbi:hypothetical protein D6851_00075 [Altericroceibacterium spongiae]|uniref:DUF429 domain-containing protein n=1 Tax=Altericroceibacterium spongiae TaxID=2320269 RepID=A0A420EQJ8_9SPHN|nr:hypothetical protein [Altericroceibacterium spongiae]RKF22959.1 hypothetical protein D6851_00075 [Altericroceibacterium spongiae]
MGTISFRHFAGIDWSGAAGERHKGIALALCSTGHGAPVLIRPGHRWSRPEVLRWLCEEMPADTLVGIDLGISLPFADCDAFFPGWQQSPATARGLWALVDQICAKDPYLGANSFVDHPQASRYFRRHGGREGVHFRIGNALTGQGRFRLTEKYQRAQGCKPYSNFNLVGAAQVGKSSLTGMRLLHRLGDTLPVWPIDPLPERGSVVVEIYTTIAAMAAGRTANRSKMRKRHELNAALQRLQSETSMSDSPIDDHQADALITAAWLRIAAQDPKLWHPTAMSPAIARSEGWTFGVK